MIPKIIHYCWFGGAEIPGEYKNYIAEWEQMHPQWEIRRWDESSFPVDNPYMHTALANKNWANASNYARLFVLKKYGGIYLDTDIKLIKPLDQFLSNECFLGFEQKPENEAKMKLNNAVLGSAPNNEFITKCYDRLVASFDGNEQADLSSPCLTTDILIEEYSLKEYGHQVLSNIEIFPVEYFYPIHVHNAYLLNKYSEHIFPETCAVHMWGRSWVDKDELIRIIDYLNHKTLNQENYIKKLEKDYKIAVDKSDEIWFWKNHFEESYNSLAQEDQELSNSKVKIDKLIQGVDFLKNSLLNQLDVKDQKINNWELRHSETNKELESLKEQLTKLNADNLILANTISIQTSEEEKLKVALNVVRTEVESTNKKLETLETENQSLKREKKALLESNKEVSLAKDELELSYLKKTQDLQRQIGDILELLERLKQDKEQLNFINESLLEKYNELHNQYENENFRSFFSRKLKKK